MPKGAIADPIERVTPRERLRTLTMYQTRALLWALWDQRWLLGTLFGGGFLVARFLGVVLPFSGLSQYLLVLVIGIAFVVFTGVGHRLITMGRLRRARRLIWGDWIDFCEDAECAVGPSGNRRAPYLLKRPQIRGAELTIDLQRIHGTSEGKLEDLAGQLCRYFRGQSSRVENLPGRVPDAARLYLTIEQRLFRRPPVEPIADWNRLSE
jgi:hypothetical protein